jgi:hypothetical protein
MVNCDSNAACANRGNAVMMKWICAYVGRTNSVSRSSVLLSNHLGVDNIIPKHTNQWKVFEDFLKILDALIIIRYEEQK